MNFALFPQVFVRYASLKTHALQAAMAIRRIVPKLPTTIPYRFVRPGTASCPLAAFNPTPQAGIPMSAWQVTMPTRSIIPFHTRANTEQLLVFPKGSGDFTIHIWTGRKHRNLKVHTGSLTPIHIGEGDFVSIVCHTNHERDVGYFWIHATPSVTPDLEWEPDVERLLNAKDHLTLQS